MAYASVEDIQDRTLRELSDDERTLCTTLLKDAAVIIDSYNETAGEEIKKTVSCRIVLRVLGNGTELTVPIGATQGSMSALGYAQSWTIGGGASGELYLSKQDKKMLGVGNAIGSCSPIEGMVQSD